MTNTLSFLGQSKEEKYKLLIPQIKNLVAGENDFIANLSNIISSLKYCFDFFWVGVYLVKERSKNSLEKELVLGPFQGPIACTRISYGKGVCGAAWKGKRTIIVDDVDSFPGHIACSSFSKSEIVLPLIDENGEVFLVLDIDSEKHSFFDIVDEKNLQHIIDIIKSILPPKI